MVPKGIKTFENTYTQNLVAVAGLKRRLPVE